MKTSLSESACTLSCRYCYANRTRSGRADPARIGALLEEIGKSDVTCVHLTGGEPLLSPYLERVVEALGDRRIYITTNLTVGLDRVTALLSNYSIYSVAVSLDALEPTLGDALRGRTEATLSNLRALLAFRRERGLATRIRVHCVVSKKNISHVPALLRWAHREGIDEVSCQPVSIEPDHPFYGELALGEEHLGALAEIWELEHTLFASQYSSSHRVLVEYYLRHRDCFVGDTCGLGIPFIDACGTLWSCPGKKKALGGLSENGAGLCCRVTLQCMTCLKHLALVEGEA